MASNIFLIQVGVFRDSWYECNISFTAKYYL